MNERFGFLILTSKKEVLRSEKERDRILEDAPWSVKKALLVLKTGSPELSVEEIDFTFCPFWVQIHLPLNRMTTGNINKMGKFLGKLLYKDGGPNTPIKLGKFLHIMVEINVLEPLKNGFFFMDLPDGLQKMDSV